MHMRWEVAPRNSRPPRALRHPLCVHHDISLHCKAMSAATEWPCIQAANGPLNECEVVMSGRIRRTCIHNCMVPWLYTVAK